MEFDKSVKGKNSVFKNSNFFKFFDFFLDFLIRIKLINSDIKQLKKLFLNKKNFDQKIIVLAHNVG